ncbi:hypothetical protein SteCoe_23157 [Stentor coeruleus]|uniref:Importin subunit alpha n=1 Tax=Stentor coeruleus TaxID=5963 RepID=A0A1R2BKK3_9CILI|nr:hypothetical protein SteCoe_23157 [Stentor coeruleus]
MEDNERAKSLFGSFDVEQAKKSKEKTEVQLRQSKREALAQKHRNLNTSSPWISLTDHYPDTYSSSDLPAILSSFSSQNDSSYLYIAHAIRILLCHDDCPLEDICRSEVMNHIQIWLNRNDFTQLQYETAWICTNISSSPMCYILYNIGVIQSMINLLYSSNDEVRYQISWALGNISADTPEERDYLLSINAIEGLEYCLKNSIKEKHTSTVLWALTNLCRTKPIPHVSAIKSIFPLVVPWLKTNTVSILIDILWALCGYTKSMELLGIFGSNEGFETMRELLNITDAKAKRLALRVLGGLFFTSGTLTQDYLNRDIAKSIKQTLKCKSVKVKKEAIWALGNACGETDTQIHSILAEGIFEIIIKYAQSEVPLIRRECAWTLCNTSAVANFSQLVKLLQMGLIHGLISLLKDGIEVNIVLQGMTKIFDKCLKLCQTLDGHNLLIMAVDNCQGIGIIEKYTTHNNEKIVEKSLRLLRIIESQGVSEDNHIELMQSVTTGLDF